MSDVHYVTDNLNLNNTFNKGPRAGELSSNADLYRSIFLTIYNKALRVSVTWMPSHLSPEDERPAYVTSTDLKGNAYADDEAKLAAKSACVPLNVSAPVLYYFLLVRRIQKRLATIVGYFPERSKHKKVSRPTVSKPSLDSLMALSQHEAFIDGTRLKCARCLHSYHKDDPACRHFLSSACSGVGAANDRPVPLKYEAVHVGKRSTHHTHVLFTFKGLIYCNKCGMRCKSQLHNLSRECRPPTAYGKETFKAIADGKLLKGPTYRISSLAKSASRTGNTGRMSSVHTPLHTTVRVGFSPAHHYDPGNSSDEEGYTNPVLRTYAEPDYIQDATVDEEQLHSSSSRRRRQRRMLFRGLDGLPLSPVVSKSRVEYDSADSSSCSDPCESASSNLGHATRQLTRLSSEQAVDEYTRRPSDQATNEHFPNAPSSTHPPSSSSSVAVVPLTSSSVAESGTSRQLARMTSDEAVRSFFNL